MKASWLHPHNPQTYTQRDGKVGLEEHQESKMLCWMFIHRSNYYYFFNSSWLSPLYFWSNIEVFASHLALKQVHCKHILAGLISIPFLYFTKSLGPISSQYKCRRPQLEIAPGCVVVQTSSEHARPTTIQTLSPLFRSAKTPSRIGQTDESAPTEVLCPRGILSANGPRWHRTTSALQECSPYSRERKGKSLHPRWSCHSPVAIISRPQSDPNPRQGEKVKKKRWWRPELRCSRCVWAVFCASATKWSRRAAVAAYWSFSYVEAELLWKKKKPRRFGSSCLVWRRHLCGTFWGSSF